MMKVKIGYSVLIVGLLVFVFAFSPKVDSNSTEKEIQIIPKPANMEVKPGTFAFNEDTKFVVSNDQQKYIADLLISKFEKAAGFSPQTISTVPKANFISFNTDERLPDEAYELEVLQNAIKITASSSSGFIYALESLRQLLPVEIESPEQVKDVTWHVPGVVIKDQPRFKWRGLMLDVSRHFFEKDYVLDVIDRLAMLKMNTLHLHLIDDQGWRIEIKKYPKLTEVGGFRVDQEDKHWNARPEPKKGQEATYGGFYTQEEIKEIVSYATSKGITVVPEIEMPAHVMSAIAAYPELSCNENEIMVPSGGVWPITDIYCAGKDSTFEFLEDVLVEVMDLFPSKYIHVGGDEATKTNWESCPHCQQRMVDEGLHDVEELQSYFIKRIEKFLSSHDRVLIGWDEILEGGLAPGATVMSWRGIQGGWNASEQGHDVVMTPSSHAYFDYYQGDPDREPLAFDGFVPLSKVYQFNPVVDSMSVSQKQHVLGGQANLWSEYIPDNSHSEYMMFPRLVALSEALWTPEEDRDWNGFTERLKNLFKRFDLLDINYAKSAYAVTAITEVELENNIINVKLENELPGTEIRYVLNGQDLDRSSKMYEEAIEISKTTNLKAGVLEDGELVGVPLNKTYEFHKAVGQKLDYDPVYHNSYQGAGELGLVNVLRGTKNFHDGQWQGWLVKDVVLTIELEDITPIKEVVIGSLENQGAGIYFPKKIEVLVSADGSEFRTVGKFEREFRDNSLSELKDFSVEFKEVEASSVKVRITNQGRPPGGGGAWLFLDEIMVR